MKAFFTFLLLSWMGTVVSWAQDTLSIPTTSPTAGSLVQAMCYQRVKTVAGASADELYARAREWVALTFEDAHQVLQLDDASRHLLLGAVTRKRRGGARMARSKKRCRYGSASALRRGLDVTG